MLPGANPRVKEAAAKAARDHEEILSALRRLEAALASPAPGREPAWKHRAGAALVGVLDSLNVHRKSAENEGGVIAEAEALLGRPPALAAARSQHVRLLKDAGKLLADLEKATRRSKTLMRGSARARVGPRVGVAKSPGARSRPYPGGV